MLHSKTLTGPAWHLPTGSSARSWRRLQLYAYLCSDHHRAEGTSCLSGRRSCERTRGGCARRQRHAQCSDDCAVAVATADCTCRPAAGVSEPQLWLRTDATSAADCTARHCDASIYISAAT